MVSELVAEVIRRDLRKPPPLVPIQVWFSAPRGTDEAEATVLTIESADAPLFLYTFATVLALRGISVRRVDLDTVAGRVHDSFALADRFHRPIRAPQPFSQIQFSILLTKRFAYFVGEAADAYAAMLRFDQLMPTPDNFRLIEDPYVLRALAVVLGASECLWEEFVRHDTANT